MNFDPPEQGYFTELISYRYNFSGIRNQRLITESAFFPEAGQLFRKLNHADCSSVWLQISLRTAPIRKVIEP